MYRTEHNIGQTQPIPLSPLPPPHPLTPTPLPNLPHYPLTSLTLLTPLTTLTPLRPLPPLPFRAPQAGQGLVEVCLRCYSVEMTSTRELWLNYKLP